MIKIPYNLVLKKKCKYKLNYANFTPHANFIHNKA